MNEFELTGRARTHVQQLSQPRLAAQPQVAAAFLAMREAAQHDGIDMLPCASFRPLPSQVKIWNRKFSGQATLKDMHDQPRDFAALTPEQVVWAILGWNGLPGATRRHWGTDIDVFDRAAEPPGYKVKLASAEVAPGGVYERLHAWLDVNIARFGFYRPYRSYRGGMFPEPWHLSHRVAAQAVLAALDIDMIARAIRSADDMLGRELALAMLPEIFERHVLNVDAP